MRVSIQAKTNKKEEKIVQLGQDTFEVWTTKSPHDNEANMDIVRILSKYFDVPKTSIRLVRGVTSKTKIFEI